MKRAYLWNFVYFDLLFANALHRRFAIGPRCRSDWLFLNVDNYISSSYGFDLTLVLCLYKRLAYLGEKLWWLITFELFAVISLYRLSMKSAMLSEESRPVWIVRPVLEIVFSGDVGDIGSDLATVNYFCGYTHCGFNLYGISSWLKSVCLNFALDFSSTVVGRSDLSIYLKVSFSPSFSY